MIVARNGRYLPKTGHDHGVLIGKLARSAATLPAAGPLEHRAGG
jgi:hypothetical protein